jgi:hypothetical protein
MDLYQSGSLVQASDDERLDVYSNLLAKGSIIELLTPTPRSYVNIPQHKSQEKRINCAANDGSHKAHYITQQGSRNYF